MKQINFNLKTKQMLRKFILYCFYFFSISVKAYVKRAIVMELVIKGRIEATWHDIISDNRLS